MLWSLKLRARRILVERSCVEIVFCWSGNPIKLFLAVNYSYKILRNRNKFNLFFIWISLWQVEFIACLSCDWLRTKNLDLEIVCALQKLGGCLENSLYNRPSITRVSHWGFVHHSDFRHNDICCAQPFRNKAFWHSTCQNFLFGYWSANWQTSFYRLP